MKQTAEKREDIRAQQQALQLELKTRADKLERTHVQVCTRPHPYPSV